MRRILGVAAAAMLALGPAACGDDESGSEPAQGGGGKELSGKIAVLLPDTKSSDRWEKADRRFFEEAFRAAGLSDDDFLINNAQGDPATQRTPGRAGDHRGRQGDPSDQPRLRQRRRDHRRLEGRRA